MSFNSINLNRSSNFDNYLKLLPNQIPLKAAQGFMATATVSLLIGSSLNVALIGGAVAVAATVIEAAIRPLIRDMLVNFPLIGTLISFSLPKFVALRLADSIAPLAGVSYKVTSIIPLITMVVLNDKAYKDNVALIFVV